ncbi:MAG: UDP-N-acetylmuramoyl-L-alanine--D-glutamate ligase [Planctomycetota bacterium]
MKFANRRVLVLGLGRFGGGRAAAKFLLEEGADLVVADRAEASSLEDSVRRLTADARDLNAESRLRFELGVAEPELSGVDLVVVNPAIPGGHPTLRTAEEVGIEQTQELDLFLDAFPGRVILVTGTNGKSSITSALGFVLRTAGRPTLIGGNIGHSLLEDRNQWSEDAIAVLEVSSFQLERMRERSVFGAVLAPVTVDHLDRHGTLENYRATKARAAKAAEIFLVHGADDQVAASFESPARHRFTHAETDRVDAFVDEAGFLSLATGGKPRRLAHRDALRRLGNAQVRNLLATALAAEQVDLPTKRIGLGIAQAEPLPYRLRELRPIGRVRVFDDSVATSVLASRAALETLGTQPRIAAIHWVTGGVAKCEPDALPALARQALEGLPCKPARIAVFGRVGETFGAALAPSGVRVTTHASPIEALEESLAEARETASAALLFSPAFASFDQFPNFEARAKSFLTWHRERTAD